MKSRYRSPIYMRKEENEFLKMFGDVLDERERKETKKFVFEWDVRAPIRIACFRSRSRPECTAILHRSAKTPGLWQCTTFDELGPWGDVERKTPQEALKDGLDGWGPWKLVGAVGEDGTVYGKV